MKTSSWHHPHLPKITALTQQVRDLLDESEEPAVIVALRQALYYLHVTGTFLGDDLLSPEVDVLEKSQE